ncbi:H-NS histone family protein, partial [Burkholderia multivorans]|uniref:H-NS histone family protein n=1 Tax=Burkholderia multivorans TaxID=87883 RepID=UPI0028705525
ALPCSSPYRQKVIKLLAVRGIEAGSEIMLAIEEFHFDAEELFPAGKKRKVKPRYFDPQSGAVWSGRGREPRWLKGKNRRDFELEVVETGDALARNGE